MRKYLILLVLILNLEVSAQTGIHVPELVHFDSTMLNLLSAYKIPGGQLAITYQGRLVYNRGFGYADTTLNILVQPDNIFRIASVSKSITSIGIMSLVEKGILNLDDKVFGDGAILDDSIYQTANDTRIYKITVRQLLNHSSGFKFDFNTEPLWKTYEIAKEIGVKAPTDSFELVLNWTLRNTSLGYDPGTSVYYSNFGYNVLGLVIKKKTGQKYEDYIRNYLMQKLGITDMHAGRTQHENKFYNEVTYYDYPGAPLSTSIYTGIPNSVPAQYGGYNWEIMTPCGGWVASAQDLCKLLTAVDGFSSKPDILLPSTIDTMTLKSINWPDYALGWFVNNEGYWHTGGIQGTATVIRSDTKHQLNYAILFNSVPKIYTQFYYDFMSIVSDDFDKIISWPQHDLFQTSSVNNFQFSEHSSSAKIPDIIATSDYIELTNSENVVEVKIFNIFGSCVLYEQFTNQQSNYILDITQLRSGLYFLKVGPVNRKLIIIR